MKADGQRLTQNELCDKQTESPHIQLAMKMGRVRTREGTVIDKRSSMLTMVLTELPGIGAKTAQKLEDNCDRIEDLLNDTKTGLAATSRNRSHSVSP